MKLLALTLAALWLCVAAHAQTSGTFVTADTGGAVARPTNFFAANAAAIKSAISLDADFVKSNTVPGITAATPGASRYYGTDSGGVKGYFPLPTGGGDGDMQESVYDVDGNGIVDEAERVEWNSVTNRPATFPPSTHAHAAADITSGILLPARLGSGSPGAGNYLRGDGVWDAVGVAELADMTALGESLATASDAAAARILLGLAIGATTGTVAAGDDSRFLSTGEKSDLTDSGDSTLHFHAADRARSSHTGTQARSTISDFSHASTHVSGGGDALSGNLDATARVAVRKNSGSDVGSRRRINLTEGAGLAVTIADDPANEEIDIVLSATAEGATNTAILSEANTFTATNTFDAPILANGGIIAGTLSATQFNVGTLTVSNTIDGAKIGTGINAGNITSGTLAEARHASTMATDAEVAAGYQPLDADLTDLADGSLTGSKVGTGIEAGNITAGTVGSARLGSGTANSSTYLRGDGTWATPAGGGLDVSGTATTSNATEVAVWSGTVAVGASISADLMVDGSGPTNSYLGRLIAKSTSRSGGATLTTNAPMAKAATGSADAFFVLNGTTLDLMVRGPANEKFNWSFKGSTITQAHGLTNAGGAFGVSATGLISSYDFTDNTDGTGSDNLSETNSPSYSGGIGQSRASNTSYWKTASLPLKFLTNSASPFTVAFRARADAGIASGSYGLYSHAGRLRYRWISPSNTVGVAQNSTTVYTVPPVTNQFMVHILSYDGTTNRVVWVNGTNFVGSGAYEASTGAMFVGTDSDAYARNFSFDWLYVWSRALSSNEIVKLNSLNTDNALTRSQLDP